MMLDAVQKRYLEGFGEPDGVLAQLLETGEKYSLLAWRGTCPH